MKRVVKIHNVSTGYAAMNKVTVSKINEDLAVTIEMICPICRREIHLGYSSALLLNRVEQCPACEGKLLVKMMNVKTKEGERVVIGSISPYTEENMDKEALRE